MRKVLTAAALAVLVMSTAASAGEGGRFDGLRFDVSWLNQGSTAKYTIDSTPVTAGKMTGSLVGGGIGYGFQFGDFVFGLDAKFLGGVVEGQENLRFVSIKGLALGTFSLGYAWKDLFVGFGGGPAAAIAHIGKMDTGLRYDLLSGVHGALFVKYALNNRSAIGLSVHRLRLADSYYKTPAGIEGFNPKDSWMGILEYSLHFSPN